MNTINIFKNALSTYKRKCGKDTNEYKVLFYLSTFEEGFTSIYDRIMDLNNLINLKFKETDICRQMYIDAMELIKLELEGIISFRYSLSKNDDEFITMENFYENMEYLGLKLNNYSSAWLFEKIYTSMCSNDVDLISKDDFMEAYINIISLITPYICNTFMEILIVYLKCSDTIINKKFNFTKTIDSVIDCGTRKDKITINCIKHLCNNCTMYTQLEEEALTSITFMKATLYIVLTGLHEDMSIKWKAIRFLSYKSSYAIIIKTLNISPSVFNENIIAWIKSVMYKISKRLNCSIDLSNIVEIFENKIKNLFLKNADYFQKIGVINDDVNRVKDIYTYILNNINNPLICKGVLYKISTKFNIKLKIDLDVYNKFLKLKVTKLEYKQFLALINAKDFDMEDVVYKLYKKELLQTLIATCYFKEFGNSDILAYKMTNNLINRIDVCKAIIYEAQNYLNYQNTLDEKTLYKLDMLLYTYNDYKNFVINNDYTEETIKNSIIKIIENNKLKLFIDKAYYYQQNSNKIKYNKIFTTLINNIGNNITCKAIIYMACKYPNYKDMLSAEELIKLNKIKYTLFDFEELLRISGFKSNDVKNVIPRIIKEDKLKLFICTAYKLKK